MKCPDCGREFDDADSFCPSCGKQVIEKFNPIILSKPDYDEVRTNKRYQKCAGCGAISYHTYKKCPSCQKDKPKTEEIEETGSIWKQEKEGLSNILSEGLCNIKNLGIEYFKKLPKSYQFGALAVLLILIGAIPVWGAIGLQTVGSMFILGGLVLILVTGGLFKKKKEGEN